MPCTTTPKAMSCWPVESTPLLKRAVERSISRGVLREGCGSPIPRYRRINSSTSAESLIVGSSASKSMWADSRRKSFSLTRTSSAAFGRTTRGDQGHLTLGERIASQSEVVRAIVSGYSPCRGVPSTLLSPSCKWKSADWV